MTVEVKGVGGRRTMRFRVSMHGLRMLFEEGANWRVREGIPEGGRAVGLQLDWDNQNAVVFVEHESFPVVYEHDTPPEGLVILEKPK